MSLRPIAAALLVGIFLTTSFLSRLNAQTFAEEPVTGSYKVDRDCRGRLPKGHSEMHFKLVVVDCGKEMLDGMRRSTPRSRIALSYQ
jgi:hypothetical protein